MEARERAKLLLLFKILRDTINITMKNIFLDKKSTL